MAEDRNVHIVGWPAEPVSLVHRFEADKPVPVAISFEDTRPRVILAADPQNPLAVNMNMNLRVSDGLPICIRLCEPICAESNYTIGISIFDRPVISITIRGKTRLANCREE